MSNLAIKNSVPAQALSAPQPTKQAPKKESSSLSAKVQAFKDDSVNIKSGFMPSLKGAGAGAVTAGVTSIAAIIAIDAAKNMGSGALGLLMIPVVAVPAGAIAGGVVANYTDSKAAGATLGAGVGAAAGGAAGLLFSFGNLEIAAMGAGVGAAAGALSGVVSSWVAEKQ